MPESKIVMVRSFELVVKLIYSSSAADCTDSFPLWIINLLFSRASEQFDSSSRMKTSLSV